jgi:hypothetical protein
MSRAVLSRACCVGAIVVAGILAAQAAGPAASATALTVRGIVAGTSFTPPAGTSASATTPIHFSHTRVCLDGNNDATCQPGEPSAVTNDQGAFVLTGAGRHPIVAEVPAAAGSAAVPHRGRIVLRAAADAVSPSSPVIVSPLSTEVARMMEDDGLSYRVALDRLAARLGTSAADLTADPASLASPRTRTAVFAESVVLSGRFALAAKMADRGDAASMKNAYQAAMNLEGIPRYDHIFIVILENKAASTIKNSPFAPKINALLNDGNQFTSYYATGNPSEPNRIAIASGDDFGVTDDSSWRCMPAGDTADAPDDPLPPGLAPCVTASNHNFKRRANLYSAMSAAGMTWRVYSGSMHPGGDWRFNSVADPTLVATDHVYPKDSPLGALGSPHVRLPLPPGLYATKHNASVNFQEVRRSPDFVRNNRTLGGGQWDEAMRHSPATPAGWNVDQFGADLQSGDVGQLNILEPDQCDDMHGINVPGVDDGTGEPAMASDCAGLPAIYRGDRYVEALVEKIRSSPIWTNRARRVAIVLMFDEGSATTGFNSCCGWNPSAGPQVAGQSRGVLTRDAEGRPIVDGSIANYAQGNKGHGPSVFGVLTNQPKAPKHVVDSDAYSHMSFVRTLQDMFHLADPGDDWSYMNRSKYTERFIAAHLSLLPEYANSADTHFDAVRPMNHLYVIPRDYVQKNGSPAAQVGPDANQLNAWALK